MMHDRYTTCKEVSDNLQLEGWTLLEEYYNDEYNCDVYHLKPPKEEDE